MFSICFLGVCFSFNCYRSSDTYTRFDLDVHSLHCFSLSHVIDLGAAAAQRSLTTIANPLCRRQLHTLDINWRVSLRIFIYALLGGRASSVKCLLRQLRQQWLYRYDKVSKIGRLGTLGLLNSGTGVSIECWVSFWRDVCWRETSERQARHFILSYHTVY